MHWHEAWLASVQNKDVKQVAVGILGFVLEPAAENFKAIKARIDESSRGRLYK
jgi:hypothetical protein